MIGIVVSRADSASVHIGERLRELADWETAVDDERPDADGGGVVRRTEGVELREFDDLHLELEGVAAAFDDLEFVAFASRHAGDTGPLLTAHVTGNFGRAEFGGVDGGLATAAPNAMARVLGALDEHAPAGYDVGLECTHHGPSHVGAPSMFVELGSDEPQWSDPAGARAVARAILDLRGVAAGRERTVVGLGGGHYAPRFTRIARETEWAVGHVASDWQLEALGDPAANRGTLDRAFAASDAELAVLDGDRPAVASAVEALGYRIVSESWLRATESVPLSLVASIEDELRPVEDGVSFGPPAREGSDYEVVDLPSGLLDAAAAVDPDGTVEAVVDHVVAVETEEDGNRLGARAAIPTAATTVGVLPRGALDGLVSILERAHDAVSVDGTVVETRERAFDPALAAARGVPEGPAFGRLAAGEPVEVDGEVVAPESVHRERVDHHPLDPGSGR